MTSPDRGFSINDRRASRGGGGGGGNGRFWIGNADQEMRRLRAMGMTLPNNPAQARVEAKRVADSVTRGSLTDLMNRQAMADMRRTGMRRTGANVQLALPKVRTPLASLEDKDIPFNVEDPLELAECRRWSRAFYVTHDLIPLLIDIYARFPLVGLEFKSEDKLIEQFYTKVFMDDLDYENFLPDFLGREYFIAGEVTSLAHFNESLGILSSEEVLNPDMVRVSKSLFVPEQRVQLLVKDMVEALRDGPADPNAETRSEREERMREYRLLYKRYPEIIRAAQQDDGLDISPALWSRIVNQPAPWIDRGAPFLLRSFRTLMMEESLNAAQDAVADRLYSPMILATLGIENMGDGLPWIPEQGDLDALRDDMQNALMADFKLVAHHMGLKIENVFGRESVPRFDQDYERIDLKLMQAWGIGAALIMGGTGAGGTYASSALNREVCELLMKAFQKKVIKHIRKRMEVVAEAQEHFAYEKKGGYRRPLYREVVQFNEDTGEEEIVRVPQLLLPDIEFRTLNLRDEAQERQFLIELKNSGFPISDRALAINTPLQFDKEIPRSADETVDKLIAQAEAMDKAQKICDAKRLPYPPELAEFLIQTLALREQKAQTEVLEGQAQMASPQGQAQQALEMAKQEGGGDPSGGGMPPDGGGPPPEDDGGMAGGAPAPAPVLPPGPGGGPMGAVASMEEQAGPPRLTLVGGAEPRRKKHQRIPVFQVSGPHASGPSGVLPPELGGPQDDDTRSLVSEEPVAPARNRARPEESDSMRANAPRAAKRTRKGIRPLAAIEKGPSSYGRRGQISEERVQRAIMRHEAQSNPPMVEDLVMDPSTYSLVGMGAYENQLMSDFPDIMAGDDASPQSQRLLDELLERYEQITGVRPIW